ncbi:50S ribosomal protein L29 [bioreactor metagenome]|uniref:50S ribosomal protein L29 n=1 Tax=bioreactor metagenome TaxID=1076179 RepID=A0A645D297_9ZZZZ
MKKTDKIAYRQKTTSELIKNLADLRKNLVEIQAKYSTGNQKDSSVFKKIKYEIALISTILGQKSNEK